MGIRWEAAKMLISGKAKPTARDMMSLMQSAMAKPPDRNTAEWLQSYLTNPRLAPVRKIATDLSSVPGKLYRGVGDNRKEVLQHPFLEFWNHPNPLPELTASGIWRLLEIWYQLKGTAVCVIERGRNGAPTELWPVPPHWIMDIPHRGQPYYVIQNMDGKRANVSIQDVFALKDLNPIDPYGRGIGQVEAVADEVEAYEYATKFSKSLFFNNARADYFIAAQGITEEQSRRFLSKLDSRHREPWNAYRPGIIPRSDVQVFRMSDSPREMDFIASRKDLRDTVNSHWGVPPEMLGIVENSNRATAEAAKSIYAENVLTPQLLLRQDAINVQLLPQFEAGLTWEYDDIIPQDEQYQLQVANEGLSRCAIMINEWRMQMGFDPVEGGDAFVVPSGSMIVPRDELLTSFVLSGVAETSEQDADNAPQQASQVPQDLDMEAREVQTAKEVSLNGAQIASLVDIVQAVNSGELSRESAIEIITSAFPFDTAKASAILGDATRQPENPTSPASDSAALTGQKAKRIPADRARVRRAMDTARSAQERAARQTVLRALKRQHDGIVRALGAQAKSDNDGWGDLLRVDISGDMRTVVDRVEDILRQTVDWPAQDRAMQAALRPVWQSAYSAGSELAVSAYNISVQQSTLTRQVLEAGAARVKGINDTTRAALARTIADGIAAGDSRRQLIDRVKQTMPGVSAGRAGVIAENEVHTSLMSGNFDAIKGAGIATKTWLTAGDDDVRDSHKRLNGVTIGIDERFANGLLYPGDPSGSPAETIGCRCDLIAGEEIQDQPVQSQAEHDILRADNDTGNYDMDGLVPAEPEKITEIPRPTLETAGAVLSEYEPEIAGKNYETAIIVTQSGQVYRVRGHINGVNIHGLPDDALYGAYMTHNHPDSVTRYSFSAFDISEALKYRFAELRGFDSEYEYVMRVLPGTIQKEDYIVQHDFGNMYRNEAIERARNGDLDPDVDEYHYICSRMSQDYGFYYERRHK